MRQASITLRGAGNDRSKQPSSMQEALLHKTAVSWMRVRLRNSTPERKPDTLFTDRGRGLHATGNGKVTPEYHAALRGQRQKQTTEQYAGSLSSQESVVLDARAAAKQHAQAELGGSTRGLRKSSETLP